MTKYVKCKDALYYDLVKVIHGHIPAPKVKFWSWLPIPIKGERNYSTFRCPNCGTSSFFKVWDSCDYCQYYDDEFYKQTYVNQKRERWRSRWKTLEYIFLPLLVLFGKAWYMRSVRHHWIDFQRGRIETQQMNFGPSYKQKTLMEEY